MSTDYKAIAVIGIKISPKKIPSRIVRTKLFKHDYPESMSYSPDTGKKLWNTHSVPIFTFDADEAEAADIELIKLPKGIKCFMDWDCETGETNGYLLGIVLESDKTTFIPIPDTIKACLEAFLKPINLWDETHFGLYSILYIS